MADDTNLGRDFARFVKGVEPKLSHAFYAAYGPDVGADVTAEALEYAWKHWDRINEMDNPAGYLFRVGQSKARWYHRPAIAFPRIPRSIDPVFEPGLPAALESLTKNQRLSVVLVYALEWTEQEVADVLGRSRSTVHTHLDRGLAHLRAALEVPVDA